MIVVFVVEPDGTAHVVHAAAGPVELEPLEEPGPGPLRALVEGAAAFLAGWALVRALVP